MKTSCITSITSILCSFSLDLHSFHHPLFHLSCSAHLSCLLSIPLFPLIYPFNLACVCVRWSMSSSSDERTGSASPANQSAAGSFPTRATYIQTLREGGFVPKCPRAKCRPHLPISPIWTLSVANSVSCKVGNKGWSSHYTSIINITGTQVCKYCNSRNIQGRS